MKNNGFTLVELIITITLIAIISVSIGVSINGMLSRQEEAQAEQYAKDIADAACVYAEVNPDHDDITTNSTVTIRELISAGLLSKDLINPISGRPITDYNDNEVTITWSNNEKTCSYTVPELSGNS